MTGATVTHDLSGTGVFEYIADGTRSYRVGPSGSVIDVCAELD